jgi:hypothetical protein
MAFAVSFATETPWLFSSNPGFFMLCTHGIGPPTSSWRIREQTMMMIFVNLLRKFIVGFELSYSFGSL